MANVTPTTGIDNFNGTSGTTAGADEIRVQAQNQIQSGDLYDGGAGIDTLRLYTTLDFTSILNTATSGIKNIEIIRFNGAFTGTFRSDQFGAGLLASNLNLTGSNGAENITINMVSGGSTFDMSAWQFNTWTGGTDLITVNGSTANDTIRVSSQHTIFDGGAGTDTVDYSNWGGGFILTLDGATEVRANWTSGLYDLFRNVENIVGSTGADTITGDGLANSLNGAAGNDTLDGAGGNDTLDGGAGADRMVGGIGSDTFYVDDLLDVVVDRASDTGTDLVYSSVTFSATSTEQDGIENITLTGTAAINATGNALANILTGNSGSNVLDGGAGNDQLFGNDGADTLIGGAGDDTLDGGAGADAMTGGSDNDTYYVDDIGEVVTELSSDAGNDLVYSSVTFSAAGTNQSGIENITLTGTGNINATGNALANTLTGNAGNNVLDGGTGADTMMGGAGSDTYVVDDAGDLVVELSTDTGTDLVQSSVTFSAAGTNQSGIENITLTGTSNINATGNALANTLTGNSGNNVLDGGAGADSMTGGAGSDTYVVDNAGDVVVELSTDTGTDLVQSSVTFSAAGTNQSGIENITLTGTGNINATGNALANTLTGNAGNNVLDGGTGADTMTGGAGSDTYVVDNVADDVIELASDGGTDLVNSSVTFSAAGTNQSGIENITLTGTGNINATGNALANILVGNTGNNVLDGGTGADTMTGGAGNDTYVVDNAGDVVVELSTDSGTDLVQSSVTFSAAGTNQSGIENITLTGTGNINATGNALANTLTGNAGNNVLDGGTGADTMTGGAGNDTYVVDNAGDVVVELSTDTGTDLVQSSVTFSAAGTNQSGIENITLTGTGNINATGNALANTLIGNSGNNVLDGGTGADTMTGGAGNDTYVVDNAGDVVVELSTDTGTDLVQSSVTFSAAGTNQSGIENITLTGTGNINATGNALANTLIGNSGNNVLDGGTGADTMTGGAGNDTYVVDNAGDVVVELSTDTGTDLVQSSVTFSAAGTNQSGIENITLTGTGNINATGNALANTLTGNSGNNVLDGDAGADTMTGSAGNDTYVVDNAGDVVVELSTDTGTDLVQSSVTFSAAGTNQSGIENITLTGTGNINATGNALANTLTGNSGNNVLDGDAGADTMTGGAGNDTYVVDDAGDVVVELSTDTGTDLVQSSVTFSAAGTNQSGIENITLTGTGNINATGNALANTLTGNAGNNVLDGGTGNDVLDGGSGADTLIGGTGNDTFYVDDAGDIVIELSTDTGTDLVQSLVTFSAAGTNQSGIENITLTGTGNINATGNALANTLTGNAGNNVLDGGAGADTMIGGAGSDVYYVDNLSDAVTERAFDVGTDLVYSSVTFSAAGTNQDGIENITLTGATNINATGNALANIIIGNTGNNVLNGGGGNDTLTGALGNDTLSGGTGADVFTLDVINTSAAQADDVTDFSIADGDQIDLQTSGPGSFETLSRWMIRSNSSGNAFISGGWNNNGQTMTLTGVSASSLTANQFIFDTSGTARNLTGTVNADMLVGALGNDTLIAGDGNDFLLGDGGSDILIGGNGNDVLDGGTGGDTMTGGAGNDIYYVDDAGDVVNELVADGGVDQVDAWITYALTGTAAGVEKAYLRGIADINLTGNDLNNSLYGNSGNNQISGGDGNDQIFAGDGADVLDGGAGNDNLNGDSGNDILLGGQGNDVLNGGLGADQMTGGAGNDTYSVDNLSDVVFESVSDGGMDTVKTWISFSLTGTAAGVENGALQGTANIDITGNGLNNALTGNAGDNRIDGGDGADTLKGGAGNDVVIGGNGNDTLYGDDGADLLIGSAGNDKLYGGNGADIFQFARGSGTDTIYDFTVSADKLDLTAYGIESAAELLPYASNSGTNLRINFGSGDIITLQNVQLAQVHDGMFVV